MNAALQDFQCKRMGGPEIILNKTGSFLEDSKASIYVINLRNMINSEFIKMCRQYGNVLRIVRPCAPRCGILAPYGFVQYEKEMEAFLAIHSINNLDKPTTSHYSFIKFEEKLEDFLVIHSKTATPTDKPTTPYILPRTFKPPVMLEAARFKKPLDIFCDSYAEPNSIGVFLKYERSLYKLYEDITSKYDLLCMRFSYDNNFECCSYFEFLNYEDMKAVLKELKQLRFSVSEVRDLEEACVRDGLEFW